MSIDPEQQELEPVLEDIQAQLAPHFRRGFLRRSHTVFQFRFDHDPEFFLTVTDETFEMQPGVHPRPTLNVLIDRHKTCWRLLQGQEDGMRAFMAGKYRADGNIVLSQLLLYLFKPDDSPNIYEVQD